MHPQTACRRFREGVLPVPAVRVNQWTVLISPDAPAEPAAPAYGLCARVSSHGEQEDLDRLVARLVTWGRGRWWSRGPGGAEAESGDDRITCKGLQAAGGPEGDRGGGRAS